MQITENKINNQEKNISDLIDIIKANNSNADIDLISKAYDFASNAHKDQFRLSGEPYISHPLNVSIILANLNLDTPTITAALLHDVVEDTENTIEKISTLFSEEIAHLIDGVTKISSLKKRTKYDEQADTLRKMLMATVKDVRVIIIKLADKLHNLRTIQYHNHYKQLIISREVLDIYAPMANRLGMSNLASELEDISFSILHPMEYNEIQNKVVEKKQEIEESINNIKKIINDNLNSHNIEAAIRGRAKHYYSIYRKMKLREKPFDDIFDIRAIRIITDEVKNCYGILGIIHSLWTPIISRFKDYIAVPKSNMYQSLHTTVVGPNGHPLECQIRTSKMHQTAQNGIAAHWLYKEFPMPNNKEYREITLFNNIQNFDADNPKEFLKELKMDLYEDEIFTFTPKGKIIKLAKGSTPVDFAYAIHSEIGHKCAGAKVNNMIVPLKHELSSGDIIEIKTSKKAHPSESWLKFIKSSNARYKIRNWLRKSHDEINTAAQYETSKEKKIIQVSINDNELFKIKHISKHTKDLLSIEGTSNIQLKLSQCCQPIPGDNVIGFVTRGRGLTVHKKSCPSLKRLKAEEERFINILWESSVTTYPVKIIIKAIDRQNLLKDIADKIASSKINIIKMEADVKEGDNVVFKFILEIKSIENLNDLLSLLKSINNVTDVYKSNEKILLK